LICVWHTRPLKPSEHEQKNEFTWSWQVPPLPHGADAHSSMSVWHSTPL
jgi:hypothetical protein